MNEAREDRTEEVVTVITPNKGRKIYFFEVKYQQEKYILGVIFTVDRKNHIGVEFQHFG